MSTRSLNRRLDALEAHADPQEPPPFAIEQDAPGAPVRFYRGQPVTWGTTRKGKPDELSSQEFRRRYVEPFPGRRPFTWADQPWTADLFKR